MLCDSYDSYDDMVHLQKLSFTLALFGVPEYHT
uniref:Uncharacterized protein n=1 Tax=Anguilla anguilla TaxID=7936 RepID=A0A0E9W5L3_ANGAN